jgi:hypothetical protein
MAALDAAIHAFWRAARRDDVNMDVTWFDKPIAIYREGIR